MKTNKFPKCSQYGLRPYKMDSGNWDVRRYADSIEQALTLAESKGAKAEREVLRTSSPFLQGQKLERERIYDLLNGLRRGKFVYNDEIKLAIDMIKDEITR